MKRFTFEQFVHYGKHHGGNIVNGMPWSFTFYGRPVTHLSDDCYLILGGDGEDMRFDQRDSSYITIRDDGSMYIVKLINLLA